MKEGTGEMALNHGENNSFRGETYHGNWYEEDSTIGTQIPSVTDQRYIFQCGQNITQSGTSSSGDFIQQYLQAMQQPGDQISLHTNNTSSTQMLGNQGFGGIAYQPTYEDDMNVMNMSYTQMLLSIDAPSSSQAYFNDNNNTFTEPMGLENHTFMITGRHASPGPVDASDNEEEEDEQTIFGEEDEEVGNTTNVDDWQCDDNGNDTTENISDCIGADDTETDETCQAQAEKQTNTTQEQFADQKNADVDVEVEQDVEQLTPEDIRIFLENEESVAAAESYSQELISKHAPHKEMVFHSEIAAYSFYNEYAQICGFSVVKAFNYKGKNTGNEVGSRRTYKCNRSGKVVDQKVIEQRKKKKQENRQKKKGTSLPTQTRQRKRNTIQITGCEAKMTVTLDEGKWVVTNLVLDHNHELSPHDETKFLRSHKHMTDQEKLFIRTFTSVKLPTRKIMAILTYLRGGKPKSVPYSKKDVSNQMTSIRNENNTNDLMQVLAYFRKRQSEDPQFYYAFKFAPGSTNKTQCIFWTDGYSRQMYDLYGDCLSFDTTYKTNKYNLPFAPFVGVNGHGQNCLFACAMVHNETTDTFQWLFQTFLHCMGGKQPVTVITDQCVSMGNAIQFVFTSSRHRNCFFHIKKKAQEKCGRSFGRIPNFHSDFCDILRNSLTVEEFESLWPEMIERYNVHHLNYLQLMWKYREKFVPVYYKKDFFPFIQSTARSEGTNAIFKDNVGSTFSVISFLGEYQKISENIEERQKEQDSVTRVTDPDYCMYTELELQAGRLYNRKIFYKFQKQILFSVKLHLDELQKHETYAVYKSQMLRLKDFRSRQYIVSVNIHEQDFSCICCKFQKDGIVCAHILRVLTHLNMSELPEKYYIARWKPKDRKDIRDKQFNIPIDLTTSNRHLRYTVLSRRLSNIASEGCVKNRQYLYVTENCKVMEERLDEMAREDEMEENKNRHTRRTKDQTTPPDHLDGYGDKIQDPDVAPSTGRPKSSKRQKTFVEELMSKNEITCSHCGSHDHNFAGCLSKHIDKSEFDKKTPNKKKAAANRTSTKQPKKQAQPKSQTQRKTKKQQAEAQSTKTL